VGLDAHCPPQSASAPAMKKVPMLLPGSSVLPSDLYVRLSDLYVHPSHLHVPHQIDVFLIRSTCPPIRSACPSSDQCVPHQINVSLTRSACPPIRSACPSSDQHVPHQTLSTHQIYMFLIRSTCPSSGLRVPS